MGRPKPRSVMGIALILALMMVAWACGDSADTTTTRGTTAATSPPTTGATMAAPTTAPEQTFVERMNERLQASGEDPRVVWVAGGGLSMEAHLAACLDPFAEDTGAEVVYVEGPVSLGFLKADVDAPGPPTLDTMKIGTQDMPSAIEQRLIQEIDFSVIDLDDLTPFQYEDPYAVQHSTFGAAVFYNTDKWPDGGPVPETWADFWDTDTFPGPRGADGVNFGMPFRGMTEAATVVLGGDPTDLYPYDVEAALAKLDELVPDIGVFYDSGATITQIMLLEEIDMIYAWTGRAWDAIQDGAPFKIMPKTHVLHTTGTPMVIPVGANSPTYASAAIGYCAGSEGQAGYTNRIIYAPSNVLSVPLVNPELSEGGWLGTDPAFADTTIVVDPNFYIPTLETYQERWVEWRTGAGG